MCHVAQLGSAILLGCYVNSGSINGRLQLEFLYVNTSGFILGFYYYYNNCRCLRRICFFFNSSYFETRKKFTWKTCSSCCAGTGPRRAGYRQSPAEARAAMCQCGFFLSWSHSKIRVGIVCQWLQPNFSCLVICTGLLCVICGTGALKNPSELSQCGGSLPPTFIHSYRHRKTVSGLTKLQRLKASVSRLSRMHITLCFLHILESLS